MANLRIVIGATTKGLRAAAGKFKSFASSVGSAITSKMGMLFGAGTGFAAARGMGRLISSLDAIGKASKRMGVTAEAFQKLTFAARRSGAETSDVEKAFKRMSSTILDAENGLMESKRALEALGLTVDQLKGKSPEQQFETIADALADVADHTEKAALAQDLFGRAGTKLIPMINNYRALGIEIKRLRGIIDEGTIQAAEEAKDAIEDMEVRLKAFAARSGAVQATSGFLDELSKNLDTIDKGEGPMALKSLAGIGAVIFAAKSALSPDEQEADKRSAEEIQEQVKAFRRNMEARLNPQSSTDLDVETAATTLGAGGSTSGVDALRAIGANAAGGSMGELAEQTQVLKDIRESLKRDPMWDRTARWQKRIRIMDTVKDGAK